MFHKDLLPTIVPAGILSAACAVFGWTGLIAPQLLGWAEDVPLLVKGVLLVLALMPVLWLYAARLHLRSYWVYRKAEPVPMTVNIEVKEDSDSTSYYALLTSNGGTGQARRVPVYPPRWNVQQLEGGTTANVYIDPVSGKPLVIEVDGKRLWSMQL